MAWDIFGGLFDRDGETDLPEQAIEFSILYELIKDEEDEEEEK